MKKTITTGLLMILMIIMNINVKAQVLNNVFTDKNSFGPVQTNYTGINYTIIKDTLYVTGSTSFIKAQGTDTMSFPNVVFMHNDFNNHKLYIVTKNNGLYMYDPNATNVIKYTTLQASGIATITGCTTNNGSISTDTLYISTTNKLFAINLSNAAAGTNTAYISTGAPRSIAGITAMSYNTINQHLLYSIGTNTGTTVYEYNTASTNYTYTVNDMEFFNGSLYYATNHGVYNSTNPTVNIVDDADYNIIKSYNSNLYFAKSTSEIFKCNALNNVTPMSYNTTNTVSKVNSITYVQTWDTPMTYNYYLWIGTDKGLFIDIADSIASNPAIFNRLGSFTPSPATGTNTATSINESMLQNASGLYPIPNNGSFSYKTNYAGTLQIINIAGQVVFEQKLEEGTTKIEMKLSSGIYITQFNCEQGVVRKKFVVD
jgi:hypothetical protein